MDLTQMVISCGFMHSGGNSYVVFQGREREREGVTGAPNCAL